MKIAESSVQIQSSGIQSEAYFTIKESNVGHIFGILRNQLYSNKPLAIIREYCTNAFDAHVDAGIPERPIEVSFPTHFKKSLTIRDFGKGLSENEVFTIFNSYGESTKRGTNDQVGMLGLGSKSAFCYVNDFKIVSHHDGVKSVYLAYIDESNKGKISLLSREATDETGLAIDIVIKSEDLYSFREVASNFLYEFNPQPIVLNDDNVVNNLSKQDQTSYIIRNDRYAVVNDSRKSNTVRMGNVNYDFDLSDLRLSWEEKNELNAYVYAKVKIFAPIGSVVPSASRESLEMNTQTIEYIKSTLFEIKDEIRCQVQSKCASIDSMYQFALALRDCSTLMRYFKFSIDYRGEEYNYMKHTNYFTKERFPTIKGISCVYDGTRNNIKVTNYFTPCEDQTIFYFYKNVKDNTVRRRILDSGLITQQSFLLEFDNYTDAMDIVNHKDFAGIKFVDVSTLQYNPNTSRKSTGKYAVSEVYAFLENRGQVHASWDATSLSLQDTEGVYIEIKRFQPVRKFSEHRNFDSISDLQYLLDNARKVGVVIPKVYGVKYCDIDSLGDGWVELGDYIQQAIYNFSDNEIERLNSARITYKVKEEWRNAFHYGMIDCDRDLTRIKEIINQHYNNSYHISNLGMNLTNMLDYGFKFDLNTSDELDGLIEKTLNKYPILRCLFDYDRYTAFASEGINKYWQNVNGYLKGQDYLHSEGLG